MKSPLEVLPEFVHKMDGWKLVADMSTAHLNRNELECMGWPDKPLSVIGSFEYGYFVQTHYGEYEADKLKEQGFSDGYINMLKTLFNKGVCYICFDQDAPIWPDYPTHEHA